MYGKSDKSFLGISNSCDPSGIQLILFANVKSTTQTPVSHLIIVQLEDLGELWNS